MITQAQEVHEEHRRCMKTLGLIGPPTDTHINQREGLMDPLLTTRFYSRRTVQSCDDVGPVSRTSPTLWWCQSSFRWKSYVVMMSYTQQQLSLLPFHLLQKIQNKYFCLITKINPYLFIHLLMHSFIYQFIDLFTCLFYFIYAFIYWFIHSTIYSTTNKIHWTVAHWLQDQLTIVNVNNKFIICCAHGRMS